MIRTSTPTVINSDFNAETQAGVSGLIEALMAGDKDGVSPFPLYNAPMDLMRSLMARVREINLSRQN